MNAKKHPLPASCFPYILVRLHRIFKILVPTPHNYGCIIGGRDKNVEDSMILDQDMCKTRYGQRRFFRAHTLAKYSLQKDIPLLFQCFSTLLILYLMNYSWANVSSKHANWMNKCKKSVTLYSLHFTFRYHWLCVYVTGISSFHFLWVSLTTF